MQFWLEKVILWPKNISLGPRIIEFENNMLNIIYGDSRTGKSSIIPIVDYCFCSGDCRIPVDTIRDATSWFGVQFRYENRNILICRKEPGGYKTSGDMYYRTENFIDIPQIIEAKNASVDDVKNDLNQLFGMTNIQIGSNSEIVARPSFRDAAAFLYQPQNIIANPEALFYKLDDFNHKRKLAGIFPYLLGAITESGLIKEKQLELLEMDIKRKEREYVQLKDVSVRWKNEAEAQIDKAIELGVTNCDPTNFEEFQDSLAEIKKIISLDHEKITLSVSGIETTSEKISILRQQESEISASLSDLETRLAKINEALRAYSEYERSRQSTAQYLGAVDWIAKRFKDGKQCPICGGDLHNSSEKLKQLARAKNEIEKDEPDETFRLSLAKESLDLRGQIHDMVEQRNSTARSLRKLEELGNDGRYRLSEIERFLGQLESSYKQYTSLIGDNELAKELDELNQERKILLAGIDREGRSFKINTALSYIAHLAHLSIAHLDVEHPDWDIIFDYKNLSLKIRDREGQERYLNQIGSASNWLSYHISLILGLHAFFQTKSPINIPSFLICDQPSQVYFPHGYIDDTKGESEDRDKDAVRRIFIELSRFIEENDFTFQIIVTEHAGEDIWGEIENKKVVAHWTTDGEKLIPDNWLPSAAEPLRLLDENTKD